MAEKEYQEITQRLDDLQKLILAGSKEVLSIEECAIYTNLSVNHLYRLTSRREIPFYKPRGGVIYFNKAEIVNWLLQGRQATNEEISSKAATHCALNKK